MRRERQSPRHLIRRPSWDSGRFRIHDPTGFAKVLVHWLSKHYPIRWKNDRPEALWYRQRKPKRELFEAEFLEAAKGGDLARSLLLGKYGESKSEIISRAASDLEISYAVLFRLMHGQQNSMSWKVQTQIKRLTKNDWSRLERFLLSKAVRRARREYDALILREVTRYQQKRRARDTVFFLPGELAERDRFARLAQDLGLPARRLALAELRVFDPIIAWRRLRFTLSEKDRLSLVKIGFKRERELLKLEQKELAKLYESG